MKKMSLSTVTLIVAIIVMVSCSESEEKKVKTTAEDFLTALLNGDLDKAGTLTTTETHQKWGDFAKVVQEFGPGAIPAKINVSDVKVNGEDAEVLCSATIPYFAKETTILHLKKENGVWLVNEPNAIVTDIVKVEETVISLDVDSVGIITDSVK